MNSTIARVVGFLHRDVDPDIKGHIEKWHDENPEVTSTVNFKSAPLHSSPIIDYINIGSSWHALGLSFIGDIHHKLEAGPDPNGNEYESARKYK